MQSEYGDECQLDSDQGQPGDGEHGADVGDAAALLPNHHRLRPVQEQLSRRKLTRSQLVLHLGHLDMLLLVEETEFDDCTWIPLSCPSSPLQAWS